MISNKPIGKFEAFVMGNITGLMLGIILSIIIITNKW